MNILVINGPNIDLIGRRNTEIYGTLALREVYEHIIERFPDDKFTFYQTNYEGELIQMVHEVYESSYEGLLINPAGYTHTSVALRDALEFVKIPKVAVHFSNIEKREDFRKIDYTYDVVDGRFMGKQIESYYEGINCLIDIFESRKIGHKERRES